MTGLRTLAGGLVGLVVWTWGGPALMAASAGGGLANPFAKGDLLRNWERTSNLAEIRNSVLYLDGLRSKEPVAVFRKEKAFINTRLAADFRVQRLGSGERIVRLILGSTDSLTYHALEVARRKVSLIRVAPGEPPKILRSRAVRDHEGSWRTARIVCNGTLVRAFFEGQLLYVVQVPELQPGLIGVSTSRARVEVRGLEFGGTPTRLRLAWRLRKPDEPTKGEPKRETPR